MKLMYRWIGIIGNKIPLSEEKGIAGGVILGTVLKGWNMLAEYINITSINEFLLTLVYITTIALAVKKLFFDKKKKK